MTTAAPNSEDKPKKQSKIVPRKPPAEKKAATKPTESTPLPKLEPELTKPAPPATGDVKPIDKTSTGEALSTPKQQPRDAKKDAKLTDDVDASQPISKRFMTGDLVKLVMREIGDLQVPLSTMTDAQREQVKRRVTEHVREAVKQACEHIAASERPAVHATIDSVMFKDGIKVVMNIAKTMKDRHAIADAQGGTCLLVLADYAFVDGQKPEQQALL